MSHIKIQCNLKKVKLFKVKITFLTSVRRSKVTARSKLYDIIWHGLWSLIDRSPNNVTVDIFASLFMLLTLLFYQLTIQYKHGIVWTMFAKFDPLTSNSFLNGPIKKLYTAIDFLFHKLLFEYKHNIVWTMFDKFDLLTSNFLLKLLVYSFLIEPFSKRSNQKTVWHTKVSR